MKLALLLIFSGISYSEEIFVKTGDKPGNSFSFNVNYSNSLKTSITAELSGFYHSRVSHSGTDYSNVYIKDQVSLGNPGEASLPVVTKFVQIPNNRSVRVVIRNSAYEVFSNFRVAPYSAPPLRDTRGNEKYAAVNSTYYTTNEFSSQ
ncbi:MAG: hypothetical protein IPG99_13050 [Ignavibacteria bacterium]|nr:hypothetical protein [Ignavibacteria bacterium]